MNVNSAYYGSRYTYYTPAHYRSYTTPYNYGQVYQTRGAVGWMYNPWYGLSYTVTTPASYGYSISPYYGYRNTFAVPSMTYTVPAGYVIP